MKFKPRKTIETIRDILYWWVENENPTYSDFVRRIDKKLIFSDKTTKCEKKTLIIRNPSWKFAIRVVFCDGVCVGINKFPLDKK